MSLILNLHKALQFATYLGISQFLQCSGFDLPDPLTGYGERPSHFFEGMLAAYRGDGDADARHRLGSPCAPALTQVFKFM